MSAGGKPDLDIKVSLNGAEALAMVAKLEASMKRMGKEGAESAKQVDVGVKGLGASFRDLAGGVAAFGALKSVAGGVVDTFKQSAQEIERMAKQFVELRAAMQQVAALSGKDNSNKFTVQQANQAAKASLMPEEWVKFQEQFQSFGGAYLDGPEAKMKGSDATIYQQNVAKFAKARGINASEAAEAAANVLMSAKGPITANDAMEQFSKGYRTLERARTPVTQLMPQSTRLMAQGSTMAESAQLLGIQAEANPGEEGTYVENVVKALREATLKGRGDELGLKKGMSPLQQIRTAAETLDKRIKGGEDQDELLNDYFNDIREFKGMQGFLEKGVRDKGFDRFKGYSDETAKDYVQQTNRVFDSTDNGRYLKTKANLARAEAERGARFAEVENVRLEAQAQLTDEGAFERPSITNAFIDAASWVTGGGISGSRERMINQRALGIANNRAGTPDDLSFTADDVHSSNRFATDNAIRQLLEEQNTMMREQESRENRRADAPIAAPPPRAPNRLN